MNLTIGQKAGAAQSIDPEKLNDLSIYIYGNGANAVKVLANAYILLYQKQVYEGITDEQIEQVVQKKIERTLDVIEGECNES